MLVFAGGDLVEGGPEVGVKHVATGGEFSKAVAGALIADDQPGPAADIVAGAVRRRQFPDCILDFPHIVVAKHDDVDGGQGVAVGQGGNLGVAIMASSFRIKAAAKEPELRTGLQNRDSAPGWSGSVLHRRGCTEWAGAEAVDRGAGGGA